LYIAVWHFSRETSVRSHKIPSPTIILQKLCRIRTQGWRHIRRHPRLFLHPLMRSIRSYEYLESWQQSDHSMIHSVEVLEKVTENLTCLMKYSRLLYRGEIDSSLYRHFHVSVVTPRHSRPLLSWVCPADSSSWGGGHSRSLCTDVASRQLFEHTF